MKIPSTLRIQGIDYTIERPEMIGVNGNTCFGSSIYASSRMLIAQKISDVSNIEHQIACVTLWHEAIHAILHQHSTNLTEVGDEEQRIDMLAHGIYQILQDNGMKLFDLIKPEDVI